MPKFYIEETFTYEIEADSADEACELYENAASENLDFEEVGITFIGNETNAVPAE